MNQQIETYKIKTNIQNKQEKIASKIKFLKLVLCDKKTIRASAQMCKINFSTAKAILNKFRRLGVIQQSYQDQDGQIDLLRQIVQIQKGIKCEQISKTKENKEKLYNQLQLFIQNIQIQKINSQIHVQQAMDVKALQQELNLEKQKEYKLVEQIVEQQIIFMKKICQ
ncbi:unnamed protein product [Paramecium sonneborni]|uniref:Uncharacterized protein n=1 Tax=Paramecium sonneborni TaxID=65129 RepID=A0A8S1NC44_9CILI|nr:unnamed protein product [Paramecium sonneborni]